ncbi:MAG: phage tail sheath subtilisin-like domain-containing protein [Deltaproteobacteria bacterium]|nr:phage tail sheath subtilisin-like domain-containing protein [Deltaproteobacteria bacterium]
MPEYLAPGVYVEEVSFRSKSIEGVPTSTTGFVGMTRTGPVYYEEGPKSSEPRLITSFTEFERVYGGLEALRHQGVEHIPYLAHAARAFFNNGGKRLYVSRVFVPINDDPEAPPPLDLGRASRNVPLGGSTGFWRARWPGDAGNVLVETSVRRSRNIAYDDDGAIKVRQVKDGAVVEVIPEGDIENDAIGVRTGNADLIEDQLRVVRIDTEGVQTFAKLDDTDGPPAAGDHVQLIELDVVVRGENGRVEEYGALGTSNSQKRAITRILQKDDPEDEDATLWFDTTGVDASPAQIMYDLQQHGSGRLSGGNDGLVAAPDDLAGEEADPDIVTKKATGLEALAEVDDIAIVAAPDAGALESAGQAADRLIAHAEKMRYRIAVVDAPPGSSMNEIREFRAGFDSTRAALYHPWIEILDPSERAAQGAPPKRLMLPPSGFVTGIYARNDITRGVHKAPANEIVRGLTRFETNINKPRQDVLNPEGINALRFFEGRGHRVWGARTMTSDQEWKYVNVRRLFNFIEHSIDKSTQWAVFEPNGPRLWGNIRRTIEDFLLVLWKQGALLGATAEESFFVRCGRETMTQNDLDNGRLICLIGISPVKPAEFVIFRIGQWTADA